MGDELNLLLHPSKLPDESRPTSPRRWEMTLKLLRAAKVVGIQATNPMPYMARHEVLNVVVIDLF